MPTDSSRSFLAQVAVRAVYAAACVLASCGPDPAKNEPPRPVATATERPVDRRSAREVTCERVRAQYASLEPESAPISVNLLKSRQRTIRKDCAGAVTSDRSEDVVAPTAVVELRPAQPLPAPVRATDLLTAESCNFVGTRLPMSSVLGIRLHPVTGDARGNLSVSFDASPALLTVELKEGRNRVLVTYYGNCLPDLSGRLQAGDAGCSDPGVLATKLFLVDMAYREEIREGSRTVEPTRQECERRR